MTALRGAAPAAERNKVAIDAALAPYLLVARRVLEIGSGAGQHALHLCAGRPWLEWQCTELPGRFDDLAANCRSGGLLPPVELDVAAARWPVSGSFDVVFTANTLHIMSATDALALVRGAAAVLVDGGVLAAYGPFTRAGRYTADSNRVFDVRLRAADPDAGLRDLDVLDAEARAAGLIAQADVAMPANNQLIIWRRFG